MPIKFSSEADLAVLRISGKLVKKEFDQALGQCKALIEGNRKIKILAVLENFSGWESADGWDDMSFADENDRYIHKFALVVDAKWHDMAYAFTAKDLRSIPIEFFDGNQEAAARAWLNA
ncbi:MAG: hypothetical protein DRQ61_04360 [Gammaproteobacteria bacterium]|nr:MAG: hypothetical protein DRQ61_04360 [Gammaproteobacteria bacterium]